MLIETCLNEFRSESVFARETVYKPLGQVNVRFRNRRVRIKCTDPTSHLKQYLYLFYFIVFFCCCCCCRSSHWLLIVLSTDRCCTAWTMKWHSRYGRLKTASSKRSRDRRATRICPTSRNRRKFVTWSTMTRCAINPVRTFQQIIIAIISRGISRLFCGTVKTV